MSEHFASGVTCIRDRGACLDPARRAAPLDVGGDDFTTALGATRPIAGRSMSAKSG
jgi:hypothetical protein